jgi:hypothetical protein
MRFFRYTASPSGVDEVGYRLGQCACGLKLGRFNERHMKIEDGLWTTQASELIPDRSLNGRFSASSNARIASLGVDGRWAANFCQSRVTALQQLVSSSSAARRSHQVDLALLGRSLQGRDRRLVRCDADSQAPICTARAVPFVCAASPRESAVASSGKNRASIRSA